MNLRSQHPGHSGSRAAFTMIEIAIALGVIGFALVAIIGILPAGLQVQRDNRSETIINQDATFWIDAIRSGARGLDDLTDWVESISLPDDPMPYVIGNGGLANHHLTTGSNIISLLTTAKRFGNTNVQAIVTAFSGSAADKDLNVNNRELSFKYRLSIEITNAAGPDRLAFGFAALDPPPIPPNPPPPNPLDPEPLESMFEMRLTFSYPYVGKASEPRQKVYRVTVSRNVLTNLFAGREYYLFTP